MPSSLYTYIHTMFIRAFLRDSAYVLDAGTHLEQTPLSPALITSTSLVVKLPEHPRFTVLFSEHLKQRIGGTPRFRRDPFTSVSPLLWT